MSGERAEGECHSIAVIVVVSECLSVKYINWMEFGLD